MAAYQEDRMNMPFPARIRKTIAWSAKTKRTQEKSPPNDAPQISAVDLTGARKRAALPAKRRTHARDCSLMSLPQAINGLRT